MESLTLNQDLTATGLPLEQIFLAERSNLHSAFTSCPSWEALNRAVRAGWRGCKSRLSEAWKQGQSYEGLLIEVIHSKR